MKKVCVIITARPSYSRIKTALKAMDLNPLIDLRIILSGSAILEKYGNIVDIVSNDGLKIDYQINNVIEGHGVSESVKSVGLALIDLASCIERIKPDLIITIADRYETIANAISAAYMNIPLIHIQGGESTGSIDNKVRHAITKLSDFHFVSTDLARKRVISMGEDPKNVFKTGCPSLDLANEIENEKNLDFNPFKKYKGTGPSFELNKGYLVVMQHPVTTEFNEAYEQTVTTINSIKNINLPVFWFWPNVDAGSDATSKALRVFREFNKEANFHFFKNLDPKDFLKLVLNSSCLIGNSSVGIRECSYLGVPVVNIGSRQIGRERAKNVIDTSHVNEEICNAVLKQVNHGRYEKSNLYGDGNSGFKISELIASNNFSIKKNDFKYH